MGDLENIDGKDSTEMKAADLERDRDDELDEDEDERLDLRA
jgi:hypothetical protein